MKCILLDVLTFLAGRVYLEESVLSVRRHISKKEKRKVEKSKSSEGRRKVEKSKSILFDFSLFDFLKFVGCLSSRICAALFSSLGNLVQGVGGYKPRGHRLKFYKMELWVSKKSLQNASCNSAIYPNAVATTLLIYGVIMRSFCDDFL